MNISNEKYNRYNLVNEMYDSVELIKSFKKFDLLSVANFIPANMPLMLTGEGSSRIFPGKNAMSTSMKLIKSTRVNTFSATDLADKNLSNQVVIGASNSGKTKEVINLFDKLKSNGHKHLVGLTCTENSLLEKYSEISLTINVGAEKAVAASKSVIAQALVYDSILLMQAGNEIDLELLSSLFNETLNVEIDDSTTRLLCNAETVYFAGKDNGVAEELTLKTNEIIRKKSAFLPGTYLLHGVEEVVTERDIIVMVDSYPDEYEKISTIYQKGIGTPVIEISANESLFNRVGLPHSPGQIEPYLKLAAGWNLLVEAGIMLGIDIDKPQRARKIGNEANV